jgi:hypothetical protein
MCNDAGRSSVHSSNGIQKLKNKQKKAWERREKQGRADSVLCFGMGINILTLRERI